MVEVSEQRGPRKRATMLDVAAAAGVGLRTVSRVVNADPTVGSHLVSRVQAAIADLDYVPDERAQQLRRGRSGTIGAAVRNLADAHPVLDAVDRAARAEQLALLAVSTDDDEDREREAVLAMCRRRVDGLVIEPIGLRHDYLAAEIDAGMPVVAVDRPAAGIAVDAVISDNASGIGMAYRQLAVHGHHRIGYLGDDERIFTGRERAAAFRACVAAGGGPLDGMVHPGPLSAARITAVLDGLRRAGATALITGNAETTIEVLRQLGPDAGRLAMIGFDDFPLADILRPALTVVAQDSRQIGAVAIDLLVKRTADPARPVQTVTVPTELIPRGSGEIRPEEVG
ncbi:LacI family DNA-binding transcriptional regulator [Actinoplanes sp. NPDC026670]|uniref:LacI family DNA-binding transcriptional regulator n=1 Tax=Actinoplanes sp. NPDC026670 TaxID=3154700 RepID=UPI0033D8D347